MPTPASAPRGALLVLCLLFTLPVQAQELIRCAFPFFCWAKPSPGRSTTRAP